jgi:peptidoglycan/xylan/chitin deacetylase (PgdA/CDA1 family)
MRVLSPLKSKATSYGSRLTNIFMATMTIAAFLLNAVPQTYADATALQPSAKISFTFDDGLASTYTNAKPILATYGLTGTTYAITNCVGMTTAPNTCRSNKNVPYMSWTQLQALQNNDGWEIGSHTVDHDCLASSAVQDPADCQTNTLTTAQVDSELANSKSALAANGINATDFAPPYGDYNNDVIAQIAKYYNSMRQFKNVSSNINVWPYSDYYLQDLTVQEKTNTVASIETTINNAINNKQWLILTFHNILPNPSTNPNNYEYGTSELQQIAAYVQSKQNAGQIQSVNIAQGLTASTANLMPNGAFDAGIGGGWTTDSPATITADGANNGSYPSPTNSVKLTGSGATGHLFSPKVPVDPNTTYLLKNFLNIQNIANGEIGFYIDEYDANGNWVSGQWKTQETSSFVENMNFSYTPSSLGVASASLQVIASSTSMTAYLDTSQWFFAATIPHTNLMPNGAFDAGISTGWSSDNTANITADGSNNGSPNNPVNSTLLRSSPTNTHLFSPMVAVVPTKTYNITSYLNLKQISNTPGSEIGFYIDEYDANGNWVSGQYKTGIHNPGAGNVGFTFTPTSPAVTKASLQVILTANANIQAYYDDVQWY